MMQTSVAGSIHCWPRPQVFPTLLVQQGLSFKGYPEWRYLSHDKVAAMGNSSRSNMMAQGVDSDRIVVTGHPGFDTLASIEPKVQNQFRNEIGVPANHKLVLFASQPSYIGAFDQPKRQNRDDSSDHQTEWVSYRRYFSDQAASW